MCESMATHTHQYDTLSSQRLCVVEFSLRDAAPPMDALRPAKTLAPPSIPFQCPVAISEG